MKRYVNIEIFGDLRAFCFVEMSYFLEIYV